MKKKPTSIIETLKRFEELDNDSAVDRITSDLFKDIKPGEFRIFRKRLTKEEIAELPTRPAREKKK